MTPAEALALGGRLGHELLTAYIDRKQFEAKTIAAAVWSAGRKEEPAAVDGATDADLGEFIDIS